MMDGKPLEVTIKIPFSNERLANIAYDVLRVDAEPKRSAVKKELSVKNNYLIGQFTGDSARQLRVGVNCFFENIVLVSQAFDFAGAPLEMPEHTPAPTPSRAVYGFVLYLCSRIFFALFFIWAIVPESWFATLNITYLPQRYWAVAIPVFLLTILATFAFIIYPSLNLCMTPALDNLKTVKESSSKRKTNAEYKKNHADADMKHTFCCCKTIEKCALEEFNRKNKNYIKYNVPMVNDLCIADVSRTLYKNKYCYE